MYASTRVIHPLPISTSKILTSLAIHTTNTAAIKIVTIDFSIDQSKYLRAWDNDNNYIMAYWFGVFIN